MIPLQGLFGFEGPALILLAVTVFVVLYLLVKVAVAVAIRVAIVAAIIFGVLYVLNLLFGIDPLGLPGGPNAAAVDPTAFASAAALLL